MTNAQLLNLQKVLKVSVIAKLAGLNHKYLAVKLHRGTPVTKAESAAITKVLNDFGIRIRGGER